MSKEVNHISPISKSIFDGIEYINDSDSDCSSNCSSSISSKSESSKNDDNKGNRNNLIKHKNVLSVA